MTTQTKTIKPTDAQYASNEKMLTTKIMKNDMDYIMRHPQEVYDTLLTFEKNGKKYGDPTIKNYLSFVLSYMKRLGGDIDCDLNIFYHKFKSLHRQVTDRINGVLATGEPSERQKNAVMDWNDIIKIRDELGKTEYASKRHLLLSVYTYMPPVRQDFGCVRILTRMPKKAEKNIGNYIILNTSTQKIVLNEYKTGHKYGYNEHDLPKELVSIIKHSLKSNPRDFLFCTVDNPAKGYEDDRVFTTISNGILKDVLKKEGACVTMLRHSFDTNLSLRYATITLGEKQRIAKWMGHNVCQQVNYMHVVKVDNVIEDKPVEDMPQVKEDTVVQPIESVQVDKDTQDTQDTQKKQDITKIIEEMNKQHQEEMKMLMEQMQKKHEERINAIVTQFG